MQGSAGIAPAARIGACETSRTARQPRQRCCHSRLRRLLDLRFRHPFMALEHAVPVDPRKGFRFQEPAQLARPRAVDHPFGETRSEEHTSELQSLIRISYAVFCLKHKKLNLLTI